MHSFAAARGSSIRRCTYKTQEWNSRVKGAIKRLNRNRKEFEGATGSEKQTQREGGRGGREPFPPFLRSIERIPRGSRGNIFPVRITVAVFG